MRRDAMPRRETGRREGSPVNRKKGIERISACSDRRLWGHTFPQSAENGTAGKSPGVAYDGLGGFERPAARSDLVCRPCRQDRGGTPGEHRCIVDGASGDVMGVAVEEAKASKRFVRGESHGGVGGVMGWVEVITTEAACSATSQGWCHRCR